MNCLGGSRVDASPFRDPALQGHRFQSVDLGTDFVEGSPKSAAISAREMLTLHWPDVRGKSVLDVGTFSAGSPSRPSVEAR